MPHLLVTNDFPPKVGGIQTLLWELWRRLPPHEVAVLTTPQPGDAAFDAAQPFPVHRTRQRVLLPTPGLVRDVNALAVSVGASMVVLDPALPVGLIGAHLDRPYAVMLHGSEVTVPGRLPVSRGALRRVLRGAELVVAAGRYAAAEAERAAGRALPVVVVPPGVDGEVFRPGGHAERAALRAELGLPGDALVVLCVTRLVPRKGVDVLIRAAAELAPERPDVVLVVCGTGRDRPRLDRLVARTGAPVRFLGRRPAESLPDLYGAADVFALACRDRWGGLEQEGFGIVFLEAAAAALAVVAGASGGVDEAVVDGETGLVVRRPHDPAAVAAALAELLDDPERRTRLGQAARRRVTEDHAYAALAIDLHAALAAHGGLTAGGHEVP